MFLPPRLGAATDFALLERDKDLLVCGLQLHLVHKKWFTYMFTSVGEFLPCTTCPELDSLLNSVRVVHTHKYAADWISVQDRLLRLYVYASKSIATYTP